MRTVFHVLKFVREIVYPGEENGTHMNVVLIPCVPVAVGPSIPPYGFAIEFPRTPILNIFASDSYVIVTTLRVEVSSSLYIF